MQPTSRDPQQTESSPEAGDMQPPPVPDQDGPHDVPDDKVIEKTLPTRTPDGSSDRAS